MLLSLHQTDENVDFISTPGSELNKTIEQAIEFCKKNSCTATLEFNGYKHKIESWMDIDYLSKNWFKEVSDSELITKRRDSKINQILNVTITK